MDVDAPVSRPGSPYPLVHSVLRGSSESTDSHSINKAQTCRLDVHFTVYAPAYTHVPKSIQFREDKKVGLDTVYEVLDVSNETDQYDWRQAPRRAKVKLNSPSKRKAAESAIEDCEAIARLHPQQRWDFYD